MPRAGAAGAGLIGGHAERYSLGWCVSLLIVQRSDLAEWISGRGLH